MNAENWSDVDLETGTGDGPASNLRTAHHGKAEAT